MTPCRSSLVMAAAISTSFCSLAGPLAHLAERVDGAFRRPLVPGRTWRQGSRGSRPRSVRRRSGAAAAPLISRAEAAGRQKCQRGDFVRARPAPSASPPRRPSNGRRDERASIPRRQVGENRPGGHLGRTGVREIERQSMARQVIGQRPRADGARRSPRARHRGSRRNHAAGRWSSNQRPVRRHKAMKS